MLQKRVVDQTRRFSPGLPGSPGTGHVAERAGGGGGGGAHDGDKGKDRGCRCGRTKCLKQYCQCFRTDVRCTSECVCSDCHNDGKHEVQRIDAVRRIRMNNATAFKGTDLEIEDREVRTPRGSVKTIRGCRCKRSKCKKKYCECFGAGLACTVNCVCSDCENGNDAGNIRALTAITKTGKASAQLMAASKEGSKSGVKELPNQRPSQRPATAKAQANFTPSLLPSQQGRHQLVGNQSQHQSSHRPPPAAPAGPAGGKGTASTGVKKSFRRNDLRVGVPVPTYVPTVPAGAETTGTARSGQTMVTPHGSILLAGTRSSPRLWSPPMTAGLAPLPGAGFRREQSSPGMLWGQPSASRRSASPGAMLMREDSQWGFEPGFGLQRDTSLLMDQHSPLSGDLKSPTTRSRALNSAREYDRGSPGIHGNPQAEGAAAGGPAGGRRMSSRSRGPLSATGAGPFGGMGGIGGIPPVSPSAPISPFVGEPLWSVLDPVQDPDGILADPGSSRNWAKNMV